MSSLDEGNLTISFLQVGSLGQARRPDQFLRYMDLHHFLTLVVHRKRKLYTLRNLISHSIFPTEELRAPFLRSQRMFRASSGVWEKMSILCQHRRCLGKLMDRWQICHSKRLARQLDPQIYKQREGVCDCAQTRRPYPHLLLLLLPSNRTGKNTELH